MKIYIDKGALAVVKKSGIGSAIHHQEQMRGPADHDDL